MSLGELAGIAGLGAFHGINPAMGWLFAVALGLQERSRSAVVGALGPIAAGHAASIALTVAVVEGLEAVVSPWSVRIVGAAALVTFAVWKLVKQRHPRWVGFRIGPFELALWSFLMATAHGAGLMLFPFLVGAGHTASEVGVAGGAADGALAVAVHTVAMVATAGAVAVAGVRDGRRRHPPLGVAERRPAVGRGAAGRRRCDTAGVTSGVVDDRLELAGREVWIRRPVDSEALLTDEAFAREEFLPYWADLWPSAIELAHVVAGWDLAGASVLELGCGLALPGIAAALRGGDVTVSDWSPDALVFAADNAERNGVRLDGDGGELGVAGAAAGGGAVGSGARSRRALRAAQRRPAAGAAAPAGGRRPRRTGRSRPDPGGAVPARGGGRLADRDRAGGRVADPHPHPGCGRRRRAAMMPSHR